MLILFDSQEMLENAKLGEFNGSGFISVIRAPHTMAKVELVEDVKTLLLTERADRSSGIYMHLREIPNLQEGDRLTITGRVGDGVIVGSSWSIALLASGGVQLSHSIAPDSVFALSHLLEASELDKTFLMHTIGWGVQAPLMDFYIDSILITRRDIAEDEGADTRTTVYSLVDDPNLQWMNADGSSSFENTLYVLRSGEPSLSVFKRGNSNAIFVTNRAKDFDGIDINLARLDLRVGNQYKVTVSGRVDGDVPEGSEITMQGIPGYNWRSNMKIHKDMEFTLVHTLTQSEVERLKALRITTNAQGASVSFFIYSIDVVRL